VGSDTHAPGTRRDPRAMAILMLIAGVSYALTSALAQKLGPRRPD
jgi:hypothetical protein